MLRIIKKVDKLTYYRICTIIDGINYGLETINELINSVSIKNAKILNQLLKDLEKAPPHEVLKKLKQILPVEEETSEFKSTIENSILKDLSFSIKANPYTSVWIVRLSFEEEERKFFQDSEEFFSFVKEKVKLPVGFELKDISLVKNQHKDLVLLRIIKKESSLTTKERSFAIFKALYFGIIPSSLYEKECHYLKDGENMSVKSYKDHLLINLYIVRSLIKKTEHESTHDFHKMKVKKWVRWQYK